MMYNLIVGATGGSLDGSRVLEYTAEHVKSWVRPAGGEGIDPQRLLSLPTLLMPETGGDRGLAFARLGHIEHFNWAGRAVRFQFVPSPGVPPIPTHEIEDRAVSLDIADWEFSRTHWAVKDVDLYRALMPYLMPGNAEAPVKDRVFKVPTAPPEPDLVSVMMPFSGFDNVYEALKQAAQDAGMHCLRADDIWENAAVIDDIVSLIWRSRVVVSDLSGKNPNVFYETGLAHAFGREVIQITQSRDDVPFDLRHLRYVHYLPNGEGLEGLKKDVAARLTSIMTGL